MVDTNPDSNTGSSADPKGVIPREQAAAEMLRRQRARESLVEYARSIDIPGAPASDDPDAEVFKPVELSMAKHHIVILEAIQKCVTTANGRLMIFAPPGSAKSSYASVVTPVWCMSKWESYRIILASYASNIAEKHSRKARSLCRQPRASAIWPEKPTLSKDQKAIGNWSLSNGSEFMAAGILAGITGNRANGILIDDPVANREDADSETIREKTKDEYQDSIDSRLLPNGWVILIQTRWHQDDLAGGILPEDYAGQSGEILCRDGQVWTVLNIPARCEREDDPLGRTIGEYLWPEWFPREHWEIRENNPQGARTWAALFQQRPTVGKGLKFERDKVRWYDPDLKPGEPNGQPKVMQRNGATDNATKDADAQGRKDFTEHGIGGLSDIGDLVVLDWWYGQRTTDITVAASIALMQRHRPVRWAHESGPIEHAIMPAWLKAMREANPRVYVVFEPMASIKSKEIKLATLESWWAQGRVWLPLNRPWAERLVDQLANFPAGKYDDACDTLGLLARLLDRMVNSRVESEKRRAQLVPFTGAWLESTDQPERKIRYS
jgi:predicted phage terminase large subunit-like protein